MVVRKPSAKLGGAKSENADREVSQPLGDAIIWDLGRAYYAYVGLLERVLVEEKLDQILRPGMGVVLLALYEQDGVSIKELSEQCQLACSTLTGVLQRMEQAELITRSRDADDGRLVRVSLTSVGRSLEKKFRELAQRMTDYSQQGVGVRNVKACTRFLRSMTAAFRLEEQRLTSTSKNVDSPVFKHSSRMK